LAADAKFELVSEKQILEIPGGGRRGFGALSPDGKSVLIIKQDGLTIRPLESREEKEVLPQAVTWATWSPDEKSVYYLRQGDQLWLRDLWRVGIESHKKELLIKNAGGVSTPTPLPSPDGKSLAFWRNRTLLLAGADGRNERVLCQGCDAMWYGMVWSPDSSQILLITGPNPYGTGVTTLQLLTAATGQVRNLTPWQGVVTSIVWPAWGSGLFLSLLQPDGGAGHDGRIWHLRLPNEERTQVTFAPASYFGILGATADSFSLVAGRMPPLPAQWDRLLLWFGVPYNPNVPHTVMLTLKK
jgi:hypothetical protein